MNVHPAPRFPAVLRSLSAALLAASFLALPALPQGSDTCATPTPIPTEGTFPFDATLATTAAPPASGTVLYCGDIRHNVWFRWQAPAIGGWVTITTCGQSVNDTSVSARSAALGVPIAAGEARHYFVIYRDPTAAGPCGNSSSTVNVSNTGTIPWNP